MAINSLFASDFMKYFMGSDRNYGLHTYKYTDEGKEQGDNRTVKDSLITIEQYKAHLEGKMGLGIVPINQDNKCRFVVIDVDIYDAQLDLFLEAIDRNDMPLVPFRSKSGGLHMYVFFEEWTSVKDALQQVQHLASILTIDMFVKKHKNTLVEIFPKQTKLQGDAVGSWINLPYYNAEDTKQYLIKKSKALSLEKALAEIKKKATTLDKLKEYIKEIPFSDAPPCLQSINLLQSIGKIEGRNNYLFSFGAYLKMKDESFFEQKLYEINNSMKFPIPDRELEATVLKSLRKKDYNYRCTQSPCVIYCNKQECKKREFGVGKEDGYFSSLDYGQLKQILTDSPYYEWQIKLQDADVYKILRFRNEDEIIKQDTFLKLCFRELHVLPTKLKQGEWFKIVNQSLNEIIVEKIDRADSTSALGLFRSLFTEFLLNRSMAKTKDQIATRKVYYDAIDRVYYFRVRDLTDFLYVTKNFKFMQPNDVHAALKDLGCLPKKINTETRKQLRVQEIRQDVLEDSVMLEEDIEEDIPDFKAYDEDLF